MMTTVCPPDYGKMLNQAYTARHKLMIGEMAVLFQDGSNGERVEYRPADAARLEAYIARLEQLCGVGRSVSGPMGVFL